MILNFLSVLAWFPVFLIRIILIVLGLVIVPFDRKGTFPIWGNREHPQPPSWFMKGRSHFLRRFVWHALRNPANNFRYLISEPKIEKYYGHQDLDTRAWEERKFAWRFVRSGIFSELWLIWPSDFRDWKVFEFRIGWKFSPVPGFGPTLQLGPRTR